MVKFYRRLVEERHLTFDGESHLHIDVEGDWWTDGGSRHLKDSKSIWAMTIALREPVPERLRFCCGYSMIMSTAMESRKMKNDLNHQLMASMDEIINLDINGRVIDFPASTDIPGVADGQDRQMTVRLKLCWICGDREMKAKLTHANHYGATSLCDRCSVVRALPHPTPDT